MTPQPVAPKKRWASRLARAYVRYKTSRALDGVHATGLDAARAAARAGPIVLASNHVAFWDPLLLLLVEEALDVDGYGLMDQHGLERVPFFAAVGALPIDRGSRGGARRALVDATRILDGPGRALWIFPQGAQRPAHLRPLGFQSGVRHFATRAVVVPVALSYPFREAPVPAAYIAFGAPIDIARDGIEPRALPVMLEARVAALLDVIDRAVVGLPSPEPFTPLVKSRAASPEGGVGARLLRARRP
jgi:1-acyl-sn-glycerol-3-phosphate acyltransferase